MDRLRKSAILVSTLDRELADAILNQMPADKASLIRGIIMRLSDVDQIDEETAIVEFLESTPVALESPPNQRQFPAADGTRLRIVRPREQHTQATPDRAVDHRLNDTPVEVLVRLLCHEMPQTIAAVLSQVSAARAAEVVSLLPSESQIEIMHRLVEIEQASVFECEAVRQELDRWIFESIDREAERSELVSRLSVFVAVASESARSRLSATLASTDEAFAEERRVESDVAVSEATPAKASATDAIPDIAVAGIPSRRVVWS